MPKASSIPSILALSNSPPRSVWKTWMSERGARPSRTRPSPARRPCAAPPNARRSRGSPGRPAGRRSSSRRRRARGCAARARRTARPPHWAGRLRWACRDGIRASCARTRWPSRFPSLSCRFACGWPLCRGWRARPLSCARRAARGSPRARPARRARWGPAASGIPRASASSSRPSAQRRVSRIAPIPGSGRRSPPSPSLSCEYRRRLFQNVDLHAQPPVLALQLDDPVLPGRAVVGRLAGSGLVDPGDPAPHRGPAQVVLGHDLRNRLAGVVELHYLALELLAEVPGGAAGPPSQILSLKRPSSLVFLSRIVQPIQLAPAWTSHASRAACSHRASLCDTSRAPSQDASSSRTSSNVLPCLRPCASKKSFATSGTSYTRQPTWYCAASRCRARPHLHSTHVECRGAATQQALPPGKSSSRLPLRRAFPALLSSS